MRDRDSRRHNGRVTAGVLLIAFGGLLLLEQIGWLPHVGRYFGPLVLIVLGLERLLLRSGRGRAWGGGWMLLVGVLLGLQVSGVARMARTWPVFVIVAGAMMVARAVIPGEERRDEV